MSVKLRKRKLPSGKVQLYLDVYKGTEGQRRFEALGLFLNGDRFTNKDTLKLADEIRRQRENEEAARAHGVIGVHKRKSNFVEYLEKQRESRVSPRTRHSWRLAIDHFQNCCGESITFGNLNRELFDKFRTYLLRRVSANSAQIYLSRIKTGLNEAVKDSILPVNPAQGVTIKREDRLPVYLTLEEIKKLADTPCGNEQVKRAFLFSCFSGLRYSDVDSLTWDKVKRENGHGYIEFHQKKTGFAERLPLSFQAMRILEEQKDAEKNPRLKRQLPEGIVFHLPRQSVVDRHLKSWGRQAKLNKSLSFHKARHSFATLALSSGVDIYSVSKLLGHRDLATTQIYAKVVDEKKKKAVESLPTLGGE